MHESIFSGIYSHCYAIFVRQINFKRYIRISFTEYAKPDFVFRTEIRFSGFRLTSLVTVTLMKTAVAKNLSQSIIICVEHQNFTKSIRQPCQYPIFGGMPGHPLASITRTREATVKFFKC